MWNSLWCGYLPEFSILRVLLIDSVHGIRVRTTLLHTAALNPKVTDTGQHTRKAQGSEVHVTRFERASSQNEARSLRCCCIYTPKMASSRKASSRKSESPASSESSSHASDTQDLDEQAAFLVVTRTPMKQSDFMLSGVTTAGFSALLVVLRMRPLYGPAFPGTRALQVRTKALARLIRGRMRFPHGRCMPSWGCWKPPDSEQPPCPQFSQFLGGGAVAEQHGRCLSWLYLALLPRKEALGLEVWGQRRWSTLVKRTRSRNREGCLVAYARWGKDVISKDNGCTRSAYTLM